MMIQFLNGKNLSSEVFAEYNHRCQNDVLTWSTLITPSLKLNKNDVFTSSSKIESQTQEGEAQCNEFKTMRRHQMSPKDERNEAIEYTSLDEDLQLTKEMEKCFENSLNSNFLYKNRNSDVLKTSEEDEEGTSKLYFNKSKSITQNSFPGIEGEEIVSSLQHLHSLMNIKIEHQITSKNIFDLKKKQNNQIHLLQRESDDKLFEFNAMKTNEKYKQMLKEINLINKNEKKRLEEKKKREELEMKTKEEEQRRLKAERQQKEEEETRLLKERQRIEEERLRLEEQQKREAAAAAAKAKAVDDARLMMKQANAVKAANEEAEKKAAESKMNVYPSSDTPYIEEAFSMIKAVKEYEEGGYQKIIQSNDTELKAIRIKLKRNINTFINQIANTKQQVEKSQQEFTLLFRSLDRKDSHLLHYAMFISSELFLKRCDSGGQISVNPNSVWSYATVLNGIMSKSPQMLKYFEGMLYRDCCYAVPFYYRRKKGMTQESFNALCNYVASDTEESYFVRMSSHVRLWISILIVKGEWSAIWRWMARFFNLNTTRVSRISIPITVDVLMFSSYDMMRVYYRQYKKLLIYITTIIAPKMIKLKEQNSSTITAPLSRLETFLEECIQRQYRCSPPEGRDMIAHEVQADGNFKAV